MTHQCQRLGVWTALIGVIAGGVGMFFLAGFIPPPPPSMSPAGIAELYQTDTNLKRLGFLIGMFGGAFYAGLVAAISVQLSRIEGGSSILTKTQSISGAVGTLGFILTFTFFTLAAFRPERNPDVTIAMHDMGFLFGLWVFTPFLIQNLVIALAVFADEADRPIFPRWVGYMNIWTGMLYLPAGTLTFFKTGPFAWNGVIGFWVVLAGFSLWLVVMSKEVLHAITRHEAGAR